MKQFVRWCLVACVAVPATVVWSQMPAGESAAPTSRPAATPRSERGRGEGLRSDGSRPDVGPSRRWGGRDGGVSFTPDEWADVEQFMQANSPVRIEMLKKIEGDLGSDRPAVQFVRVKLVQRYRDIDRKRVDSPVLYGFALRQLAYEDAVLGLLRDQRQPNADNASIERRLDEQIRGFVDNNLAERSARLERLKQIVDAQTKGLEKDRAGVENVVAAQREKFKNEMDAMLDFNARVDGPSTNPTTRSTN